MVTYCMVGWYGAQHGHLWALVGLARAHEVRETIAAIRISRKKEEKDPAPTHHVPPYHLAAFDFLKVTSVSCQYRNTDDILD